MRIINEQPAVEVEDTPARDIMSATAKIMFAAYIVFTITSWIVMCWAVFTVRAIANNVMLGIVAITNIVGPDDIINIHNGIIDINRGVHQLIVYAEHAG